MKVNSKLLKAMHGLMSKEYANQFNHVYYEEKQNVVFCFTGYFAIFVRFGDKPEYVDIKSFDSCKSVSYKSLKMALASGDPEIDLDQWQDQDFDAPMNLINQLDKLVKAEESTPFKFDSGISVTRYIKFFKALEAAKSLVSYSRNDDLSFCVRHTNFDQLQFKIRTNKVSICALGTLMTHLKRFDNDDNN